ncbi:MAG: site-specific DNA-methyltransferase [Alphaproteobacteria bacterium]|nr:site-specific DNA-methyltransferase [Alphaproteobacteria bacterium]
MTLDNLIGKITYEDCMNILPCIPDKSIDLVLTDIPYGEVNRESNGLRNLDKGCADIVDFNLNDWLKQIMRVCKGSVYIWCGKEQISDITKTLIQDKFSTRLIIWEKTNPSPMNGDCIWLSGIESCVYGKRGGATYNGFCQNTVIRCNTEKDTIHATQKPINLFSKLITTSSNENDLVLDCFSGSGTTAVACHNLKRRFICIERDKEYWKASCERLEQAQRQQTLF